MSNASGPARANATPIDNAADQGTDSLCLRLSYRASPAPHDLQQSIEAVLDGHYFYPEADWAAYNYRPPDTQLLLGAWRHPNLNAFAFLIDVTNSDTASIGKTVLFYLSAPTVEIERCTAGIRALKQQIARIDSRSLRAEAARVHLSSETNRTSINQIIKLGTLLTAVASGISVLTSRLTVQSWFAETLISVIQGVSLLTLAAFAVICCAYVCIGGALILKKFIDARVN